MKLTWIVSEKKEEFTKNKKLILKSQITKI